MIYKSFILTIQIILTIMKAKPRNLLNLIFRIIFRCFILSFIYRPEDNNMAIGIKGKHEENNKEETNTILQLFETIKNNPRLFGIELLDRED